MSVEHSTASKPLLYTLHGMHNRSHWQDGADIVLKPHFVHCKIDYKQFQHWAILQLSADLVLAIFWLVFAAFVWIHTAKHPPIPWCCALYLAVWTVYEVHVAAVNKRSSVVDELKGKLDSYNPNRVPASLIAHSLGTYLIACMLQRHGGVRFETVIFNGTVVRRTYPWAKVRNRFGRVINEVGGLDFIPYLAAALGWTIPNMGSAGARGFKGAAVHPGLLDRDHARPQCMHMPVPCCALHDIPSPPCSLPVHNVLHRRNSHGNFHKTTYHAWRYWLPSLWQLDPKVYDDFRTACDLYDSAPTQQAEIAAIQFLLDSCWEWTNGSLRNFAENYLRTIVGAACSQGQIDSMISTALFQFADAFVQARENAALESGGDPALMLALDPRRTFRDILGATALDAQCAGFL